MREIQPQSAPTVPQPLVVEVTKIPTPEGDGILIKSIPVVISVVAVIISIYLPLHLSSKSADVAEKLAERNLRETRDQFIQLNQGYLYIKPIGNILDSNNDKVADYFNFEFDLINVGKSPIKFKVLKKACFFDGRDQGIDFALEKEAPLFLFPDQALTTFGAIVPIFPPLKQLTTAMDRQSIRVYIEIEIQDIDGVKIAMTSGTYSFVPDMKKPSDTSYTVEDVTLNFEPDYRSANYFLRSK